jgi:hypothetical protein
MSETPTENPKYNWPLILAIAIAAGTIFVVALTALLMWTYNFNLLEWIE